MNWLNALIVGAVGGLVAKHLEWTVPFSYWQHCFKVWCYNHSFKWELTRSERKRLSYDVCGDEEKFRYEQRAREIKGRRVPKSGQIN